MMKNPILFVYGRRRANSASGKEVKDTSPEMNGATTELVAVTGGM
jgi:hypothetical protein